MKINGNLFQMYIRKLFLLSLVLLLSACNERNEKRDGESSFDLAEYIDIPKDIALPKNNGVCYLLTFNAPEKWSITPKIVNGSKIDTSKSGKGQLLNSDYNNSLVSEWYEITPSSGDAGEAEVMITLDENSAGQERSETFTLRCGEGFLDFSLIQTTLDREDMPDYDDSHEKPSDGGSDGDGQDGNGDGDGQDGDGTEEPDPEPIPPHIIFDDSEFERLSLLYYDLNADGYISEEEVASISELHSDFSTANISSGSDLRHFVSLRRFAYHGSSLRELNLSNNRLLEEIDVSASKLETLDVSGCSSIVSLVCSGSVSLETLLLPTSMSSLTELKLDNAGIISGMFNLSQCPIVKTVDISFTKIEGLDVSGCESITSLVCSGATELKTLVLPTEATMLTRLRLDGTAISSLTIANAPKLSDVEQVVSGITSLNELTLDNLEAVRFLFLNDTNISRMVLRNLPSLTKIDLPRNQLLSTLELTGLGSLWALNVTNCSLSVLDLSECESLKTFSCKGNKFSTLDLSKCVSLETIDCSENPLYPLDVSASPNIATIDVSGVTEINGRDKLMVYINSSCNPSVIYKDGENVTIRVR